MNLKKKIGKVFTTKFVGTGPSSYEKGIYRAAVSQRLRNTALEHLQVCLTNQCIQAEYVPVNTTLLSVRELCEIQVLVHFPYLWWCLACKRAGNLC